MRSSLAVALILFMLLAAACASPQPTPTSTSAPSATTPSVASPAPSSLPSPSPSPSPTETDVCIPPSGQLPPAYAGDPCPDALAAVRTAVVRYGLPIRRIYLVPDPFLCGELWPGVGSPAVCFGALILPGRDMHGWVSFTGTDEVAAVAVARPTMAPDATPAPRPLPWTAQIVALEVPPVGWVMP